MRSLYQKLCIFVFIMEFISPYLQYDDGLEWGTINPTDQKYLEFFFQTFFLNDDFSYTLFGDKPMSLSGIQKKNVESHLSLLCMSHISKDYLLEKSLNVLKKYQKFINSKYLFVFNENAEEIFIYFINKKPFLKSIHDNMDLFIKELGADFNVDTFFNELVEEKRPLLEMIHHHEGILGILLGYGRHNALLFQKKADILGRCWGYGEEIKKEGAAYFKTVNIDSKQEELRCLDSKLGSFSEGSEYCELMLVAPLSFCGDNSHPETRELKEKYTDVRKQINEAYSQANPFRVISNMLFNRLHPLTS